MNPKNFDFGLALDSHGGIIRRCRFCPRPGFTRIHLAPGQTAGVAVEIPAKRLRYWDTIQKQYVVEPGDYELLVGGASDDIRLRVPFKIAAAP